MRGLVALAAALLLAAAARAELLCYRKLALYGSGDSGAGSPASTTRTMQAVTDLQSRFNVQVQDMKSRFDWTSMRKNATEEFVQRCRNGSNLLYNYKVKEVLRLNLASSCFSNNFTVSFENDTIVVHACNVSLALTTQNCSAAVGNVDVAVNGSTLEVVLASGLFSTMPPFVSSEAALDCLLALPVSINFTGENCSHPWATPAPTTTPASSSSPFTTVTGGDNSTYSHAPETNGTTPPTASTITVAQPVVTQPALPPPLPLLSPLVPLGVENTIRPWQNNTANVSVETACMFVVNITVTQVAEDHCASASLETVLSVVGVTAMFESTVYEVGLEINNDTLELYQCGFTNATCSDSVFESVAAIVVTTELGAGDTRTQRRVRSLHEANVDCYHESYDMGIHDRCDTITRVRRGDTPPTPPPKSKKPSSVVLGAAGDLGAKPKLPPGTRDVQLGASGRDGAVSGSEEVYTEVLGGIRQHLPQTPIPTSLSPKDLSKLKLQTPGKGGPLGAVLGDTFNAKSESIRLAVAGAHKTRKTATRRKPLPGHASNPDFEDVEVVRQELGLGPWPGARPRSPSQSSEDDFVDMSEFYRETGRGPPRPRSPSQSSEDDFVDMSEFYRETGRGPPRPRSPSQSSEDDFVDMSEFYRETGRGPDPQLERVKQRLQGMGVSSPSVSSTAPVYATPVRKPKDVLGPPSPPTVFVSTMGSKTVLTAGAGPSKSGIVDVSTRTTVLTGGVYAALGHAGSEIDPRAVPKLPPGEGVYEDTPHWSPPNKPLPPTPGEKAQPTGRQRGDRPLPPTPEEKPRPRPNWRQPPPRVSSEHSNRPLPPTPKDKRKMGKKICKRSLESLLCGMIGQTPQDVTSSVRDPYALASAPAMDAYSLAGAPMLGRDPAYNPYLPKNPYSPSHLYETVGAGEKYRLEKRKDPTLRTRQLADQSNRADMFLSVVATSAHLSMSQASIRDIARDETSPKAMRIVNLISSVLTTVGGTLAAGGASKPMMAASGLALQGLGTLVDIGTTLYYLISGQQVPVPVDPITEKFSTYARYMEESSAGARLCMLPDSELTITLAYRHTNFNGAGGQQAALAFSDTIPTRVYYLRNGYVVYHTKVTMVCPIGTLRLLEGNIDAFAHLKEVKNGAKYYSVPGIMELLSAYPNASFACGSEVGAVFMPYDQDLRDMQLLRVATPGEPKDTESMPSDVCDLYPFKRFYLLVGNCPHDQTQTAVTYTTCGTLLKLSTWEPRRRRWVLMNPFSQAGDFVQLFTFASYDFSNATIDLNSAVAPEDFCMQRDVPTCYWTQPMFLEDVTQCTSRIRKLHVKISTVGASGYSSIVLSCPHGSTPFSVSERGSHLLAIPMNTARTSVRYASTSATTVLLSCVNNFNSALKSDVVMVTFSGAGLPPRYMDVDLLKNRKFLFFSSSWPMPTRSRTCKRASEDRMCRIAYAFDQGQQMPEYHLYRVELPKKRLHDYYTGPLNNRTLSLLKTRFASDVSFTMDVSYLEVAYLNPHNLWKFAKNRKRTFSALALTLYPCTRSVGGRYDVKVEQIMYRLLYKGTVDQGDGETLRFHLVTANDSKSVFYHEPLKAEESCSASLNITSKTVTVHCPSLSLPKLPFESAEVRGICVLLTSSRDHCAMNDISRGTAGYSEEESKTPFSSCDGYIPLSGLEDVTENFCYHDRTLRIPLAGVYDPCSTVMVLGYSEVFLESQILAPPYTKEFGYDPSRNEYADRRLYARLLDLYRQYEELISYDSNPVVRMANKLAHAMSPEAREIFRISADSTLLQTAFEADEERLRSLQVEIESTLQDLFLDTMSFDELDAVRRAVFSQRCCVLEGTLVYKYFPLEAYLCGSYSDYVVRDTEGNRYVLINDTVVDEAYYNASVAPWLTCYEVRFIPVSDEEQKQRFQETIFLTALEEVLTTLFEEYDHNITIILSNGPWPDEEDGEHDAVAVDPLLIALSAVAAALLLLSISAFIHWVYLRKRSGSYTLWSARFRRDVSLMTRYWRKPPEEDRVPLTGGHSLSSLTTSIASRAGVRGPSLTRRWSVSSETTQTGLPSLCTGATGGDSLPSYHSQLKRELSMSSISTLSTPPSYHSCFTGKPSLPSLCSFDSQTTIKASLPSLATMPSMSTLSSEVTLLGACGSTVADSDSALSVPGLGSATSETTLLFDEQKPDFCNAYMQP
ncbi:integral membrane protein [Equine molluscum contagiosum-like virus]|nr:integral membrane protein [Equine molluscum contagiosum-like virus]